MEREKIRLARAAKKDGSYYVPAESRLVFVVRIKGYVYRYCCNMDSDRDQYQQDCAKATQNPPTPTSPSGKSKFFCL